MKAYKKEPTQKFEFINTSKDVWTINGTVRASDGQVLVTGPSGNRVYDKDDFRSEYEYVFKEGVTGECRLKRVIDDVEVVSDPRYIPIWGKPNWVNVGDYVVRPECGMTAIFRTKEAFEESYELTQSDEDIVAAFRQVDAGMAHNVHLSHSNVVMISQDHYAALWDLAYGMPKQLS